MPSPHAPAKSKRPPALAGERGTSRQISMATRTFSPATLQNRMRQSAYWATAAEIGRPSAPPMPSEELISAIPEPSRCAGSRSRSALMPSGTTPEPAPCRPLPMIIMASESARAQTIEPAMSAAQQNSSMRRLP